MKKWKRTATAVLSAALIFSLLPATVPAASAAGLKAGRLGMDESQMFPVEIDELLLDPTGEESGYSEAESEEETIAYTDEEAAFSESSEEGTVDKTEDGDSDYSEQFQDAVDVEETVTPVGSSEEMDQSEETEVSTDSVQREESTDLELTEITDPENTDGSYEVRTSVDAEDNNSVKEGTDSADNIQVENPNQTVPVDDSESIVVEPSETSDGANGEYVRPGGVVGAAETSVDMGDPDALYADYANRLFYGMQSPSGKKKLRSTTTRKNLKGQNLVIYDTVKAAATEIANGNLGSAIVEIPLESLGLKQTYTTAELGVGDIYDSVKGVWVEENKEAVGTTIGNLLYYDLNSIMYSLFADCAYELYWSNGGMGAGGISWSMYSDNTVTFEESYILFYVGVDPAYHLEDGGEYDVDTEKTGAAKLAADNAHGIVNEADASDLSDYDRLTYYKDQICDLVTYNDEAAENMDSYPDNGPWSLIYVFDGNSETNVVCEAYSEAFQYLCELSVFKNSKVKAYSVTGSMDGGTGAGDHKWNIIHMDDGFNYIADITNSDENSIGYDGSLFLKGMSGSVSEGYMKRQDEWENSVIYIYDEETLGIYSASDLTLRAKDYGDSADPTEEIPEEKSELNADTVSLNCNDDMTYSGDEICPVVAVYYQETLLEKGKDYSIRYDNNINVGTAMVTITGIGDYEGTVTRTFTIKSAAISNAAVSGLANKTYTGSAIMQAPVVKAGGRTLVSGTDYTAAYSNNINVGTAIVTITGKGNYTGKKTATFKINPAVISGSTVTGLASKTYTGKALTQTPVVKIGTTTLKANSDYTIAYKNNTNYGEATVTISGKGNYTGTKTVTFKINKAAQSITAKSTASSVAVGKTATVSITGNKGAKSYKSSNTAIATVTTAGKVTANKVGTVKITATSGATSNYNAASKTVTIKILPAATTKLTAANQAKGIKLTWAKVAGANGYIIYRNNKKAKTIANGATVTWADTAANTNGTKYVYKVVAKASTGTSTLSKSITTYKIAGPAIKTLKNSASKKMKVTWAKNAKSTGYQIQYALNSKFTSGLKKVSITKAATVSKTIGSLTKGKKYYVRIRTVKKVGKVTYYSAWSPVKYVKISK